MTDSLGCSTAMLELAEGGRHSLCFPQQKWKSLTSEVRLGAGLSCKFRSVGTRLPHWITFEVQLLIFSLVLNIPRLNILIEFLSFHRGRQLISWNLSETDFPRPVFSFLFFSFSFSFFFSFPFPQKQLLKTSVFRLTCVISMRREKVRCCDAAYVTRISGKSSIPHHSLVCVPSKEGAYEFIENPTMPDTKTGR